MLNDTGSGGAPSPRFLVVDDAPGPDRPGERGGGTGRVRWVIDAGFLASGWSCLWGRGCQGIHDEPTPHLQEGCCSVGVVLSGVEEAMTIAALAATTPAEHFEHAAEAAAAGCVEERAGRWSTRVVDGACVFFNRVGFAGGPGCALHVSALAEGSDPADAKPWTCTKLPVRTEDRVLDDGTVEVTVRAWARRDWGPGGATMAWWCTEASEAYADAVPLVRRAAPVLTQIFGPGLYERVAAEVERRFPA